MTAYPAPVRAWSRHWLLYRRTWRGTIVVGLLNPLLFLTGIGIGIGKLVDANSGGVAGVAYLSWLAPGILAASAFQMAFIDSGFNVFWEATPRGSYASAASTSLSPTAIMLGHQLFAAGRIALLSVGFVIVQIVLGAAVSVPGTVLSLAAALLLGIAVGGVVAAWAITITQFGTLRAVFRFLIQPVYLVSGTFFPLSAAPLWARKLAYVSPLWHGVELCRGLSLGTLTAEGLAVHGGVLVALTVAGLAAASVTYRRRLHE